MAQEVRQFTITAAIGSSPAAFSTSALTTPARILRKVRARIPPGPAGVLGWRLAASGQFVIPWNSNQWIVGNDEILELELEGFIDSGAWQVQYYNQGAYPHTFYLLFYMDLPQRVAVPLGPVPLDLST